MTYLAQKLITNSWYLSGIVARNLQTVTGDQITDGLSLLNALLDFKQIETDLIPYWTYVQFNPVTGQEYYFLPNAVGIESLTFNIGVVRYPMDSVTRRNYYGSSRVDNIQTLPFSWNFNRGQGGGTLATYFLPSAQIQTFKCMVKLFLSDVQLNTDLTNVYQLFAAGFISNFSIINPGTGYTSIPTISISLPSVTNGTQAEAFANISNGSITSVNLVNAGSGYSSPPTVTVTGGGGTGAVIQANVANYNFLQSNNAGFDTSYIEYLRYALAQMMASEYGILFNPESEKILKKYERKLMFESPPDLSMIKSSVLADAAGLNYADVSIGRGWRPN